MGSFAEKLTVFFSSHYHSMPRLIREKMMEEGKKQLEREDPFFYSVMTENVRENYVENYFFRKESERCKRKA